MAQKPAGQPRPGVSTYFYASIWGFTAAIIIAIYQNNLIILGGVVALIVIGAVALRVIVDAIDAFCSIFMTYIIVIGAIAWATKDSNLAISTGVVVASILICMIYAYQAKHPPQKTVKIMARTPQTMRRVVQTPEQSWRAWARQNVKGPVSQQLAATAAALRALEMRQDRYQALAAAQAAARAWAPKETVIALADAEALEKHWKDWAQAKFGGPPSRVLATVAEALRVLEHSQTEAIAQASAAKTAASWAQAANRSA